jgi:cell division protein FtsW
MDLLHQQLHKERRSIFLMAIGLTLFGILMVYESSSIYAYKVASDPAFFFKRQLIYFFIGLLAFFGALSWDFEWIKRHNKELLLGTIVFLVLVIFVGKTAGGATRWLKLPGFNIQPSELLKITFLFYCADYVQRKGALIKSFWKGVMPLAILLAGIFILLIVQPDMGTAVFWVMWTIIFLFMHRMRKRYLFAAMSAGLALSIVLIKFYPYRFRRIVGYLNPFADPQGAGFQLIQSQIAYGQGGFFGVGFGESHQKLFFLPAAHTDFIFSIIAEEFGLLGAIGLLAIFFFFLYKMANIAKLVEDPFRRGILWGIIFIFFLEISINVGVSSGLLPTKGLSLPFISYGGSNLVTHYILLGLFFNATRKEKEKEPATDVKK